MLLSLSVRDLLLMDGLDVELRPGLCVLSGETGAGKSILLDALGLCLGTRADSSFVRAGAERGQAAAEFDVPGGHPARRLAAERGLDADGTLLLRRVVGRDGRSRATFNDQPVSVGFLRELGERLVEIEGQNDGRGLLDPATHVAFLDSFAGNADARVRVRGAWEAWREAAGAAQDAKADAERGGDDAATLRFQLGELDALKPEAGEDSALADERALLRAGQRIGEALAAAAEAMERDGGPGARLAAAEGAVRRVAADAAGRLDAAREALERATAETSEAEAQLREATEALAPDPARLDAAEERLFALRAVARRHGVEVDALPAARDALAGRLAALEGAAERIQELEAAAKRARKSFRAQAEALSAARAKASVRLDALVAAELGPLRLGKARFRTVVEPLAEEGWGPLGRDRVRFEVETNPGQPAGPLHRIASGGELGRFLLALHVVLSRAGGADAVPVLIFDEVDRGIGGATADAVGERLAQLGGDGQVLVVTHSPQVAARAAAHWLVEKHEAGGTTVMRVAELDASGRREELARMLAGATVTDEARAAASRLMAGSGAEAG